jgi:hypothetical protein
MKITAFMLGLAGVFSLETLCAANPQWWDEVIDTNASHAASENYVPANLGQLKNMAAHAEEHLDTLPGGPGDEVEHMVYSFSHINLGDNYAPINLGQLKAIAKPFYDRLIQAHFDTIANLKSHGYPSTWTSPYPWDPNTPASENYALANLGQLKMAFSFDLANLPDWWKLRYFQTTNVDPNAFSDADTLTNLQEYWYGTDPTKADTDYDGIVDSDEVSSNTDPADSSSFVERQLGYWQFDTTSLLGSAGQQPLTNQINQITASEWNNGLNATVSGSSLLTYREQESGGVPNINLARGTVRMWVKPSWSSTTAGGNGPQSWARLLEVGSWTGDASYGFWAIHFSPEGTYIWLSTQNELHQSSGIRTPDFSWAANQWHQITVTYSSSESNIYIDGVLVVSGGGISAYPNSQVRALGFSVGTDRYSTQRTGCVIDELETYNYPFPQQTVESGYDTDGDGLPNWWETKYGLNPQDASDAEIDSDFDGLSNLQEYLAGTKPSGTGSTDSDLDGMPDGWEVRYGTNPIVNDANGNLDSDTLTNIQEYQRGTDPRNGDTDGDGIADDVESAANSVLGDSDGDVIPDQWESVTGTSPSTDNSSEDPEPDGMGRTLEHLVGRNPVVADSRVDSTARVLDVQTSNGF